MLSLANIFFRCLFSSSRAWVCAIKLYGMANAVEDLVAQAAPVFEAATPMLSQLLKTQIAEREVLPHEGRPLPRIQGPDGLRLCIE